jgi:hypothetical protein
MKTIIRRADLESLSDEALINLANDICGGIFNLKSYDKENKINLIMKEDFEFAVNLSNLLDYLQPLIVDIVQNFSCDYHEIPNGWTVRYLKGNKPIRTKLFHGKELFDALMDIYLYHKERMK